MFDASLLCSGASKCGAVCRPVRFVTRAQSRQNEKGPRSIPLPGGVWLNRKLHDHDVLYGSTFVIQRDRVGGPGLVLSKRNGEMIQVWVPGLPTDLVTSTQPSAWGLQATPGLPPEVKFTEAVDVEACDVDPSGEHRLSSGSTALVWMGSDVAEDQDDDFAQGSSSPRRTSKLRFTCDRCGARNAKFVNPHAWNKGVVFCRCDGCDVVHLVRDGKGIFSNLKGPVFPNLRANTKIDIPPGLPQKPDFPGRSGGVEFL
ncbi:hypothetical protein BSKO_00864 [Bryopsis sp. KO-2023]|nr:hypothetical protein BSKO_00864 [Bryopsis sp. KO-2023]